MFFNPRYTKTILITFQFYLSLTQTNVISVLLDSPDANAQVNITTLQQVQIIFRHGISVPSKEISYPLDTYQADSSWPAPRGELLAVTFKLIMTPLNSHIDGEYYQKRLGQFIRKRYDGFLSEDYIENELHILSSNAKSAQDSLRATLRGMYPQYENPASDYLAFENTLYEINSLYTIPSVEDNILKMSKSCKRWDQLYKVAKEEVMKATNATVEESEQISKYSKYITEKSGLNGQDLDDIRKLHTVLTTEKSCNMSLPVWAGPLLHSKTFMSLVKLSYKVSTHTDVMKRLKSGPLLKTIANNIYKITENLQDKSMLKMFLYSGHAATVANLWNTVSSLEINFPEYTGAIIFELHKTPNQDLIHVQMNNIIFYHNEIDGMNINISKTRDDKNNSYNVEEFLAFVEQYKEVDYDEECKPDEPDSTFPTKELVSAICLLAAFPILLFIFVKILYRIRKNDEFSPLLNTHKVF